MLSPVLTVFPNAYAFGYNVIQIEYMLRGTVYYIDQKVANTCGNSLIDHFHGIVVYYFSQGRIQKRREGVLDHPISAVKNRCTQRFRKKVNWSRGMWALYFFQKTKIKGYLIDFLSVIRCSLRGATEDDGNTRELPQWQLPGYTRVSRSKATIFPRFW